MHRVGSAHGALLRAAVAPCFVEHLPNALNNVGGAASLSPAHGPFLFALELPASVAAGTTAMSHRQRSSAPRPNAPASFERHPAVMRRSLSDLQDYQDEQHLPNGSVQKMLEACKPASPMEQQLRTLIRSLAQPNYSPAPPTTQRSSASSSFSNSSLGSCLTDLEQLAAALTCHGYAVQLLDGSGNSSSNEDGDSKRLSGRSPPPLQRLQHQSLLCTGMLSGPGTEAALLLDPLIIEPRFRDQFTIQFSSCVPTAYEFLLMAVPPMFVGTLSRLEAAVALLASEVSATFKQLHRPLPPWRTRKAMMSRWSPEMVRDIAKAAATSIAVLQSRYTCGSHTRECASRRNSGSSINTSSSIGASAGSTDSSKSSPEAAAAAAAALLGVDAEPCGPTFAAGDAAGGRPALAFERLLQAEGCVRRHSNSSEAVQFHLKGVAFDRGLLEIQRIASVDVMARGRRREGALAAALRATSSANTSGAGSSPMRPHPDAVGVVGAALSRAGVAAPVPGLAPTPALAPPLPPAPLPTSSLAPAGAAAAAGGLMEHRVCEQSGWAFHFHKVRLGAFRARQ